MLGSVISEVMPFSVVVHLPLQREKRVSIFSLFNVPKTCTKIYILHAFDDTNLSSSVDKVGGDLGDSGVGGCGLEQFAM